MEEIKTEHPLFDEVKIVVNDLVIKADHFEPDPELEISEED